MLTRLCIFDTALGDEEITYAEVKPAWLAHWLDLSLLQRGAAGEVGRGCGMWKAEEGGKCTRYIRW